MHIRLSKLDTIMNRGIAEVIVKSDLITLLKDRRPLRIKMGFDPSAPDLHLGHCVGLRKLRQLQEEGHTVVVIVGDWTAQIGDPTGQSVTRPMLSQEQVDKNAETYLSQLFKIVDKNKTEIRKQSEWFSDFSLKDVIKLTSNFTVAQFLARDDFSKRYKANHPIAITEFMYPLLQAYDSVAVKSDVEVGGTDQKFNLLVGRDLQQMMGQKPQQCILVPILVGTDGTHKMSKSLGNYIGVTDTAKTMYAKTMSLPDSQIMPYFECLTDINEQELSELNSAMENESINPMDAKKTLAKQIVTQMYEINSANSAQAEFESVVQNKEIPSDLDEVSIENLNTIRNLKLSNFLANFNLVKSNSEARRLIDQNAVSINNVIVKENLNVSELHLNTTNLLKIGRNKYVKLLIN
ncbi:MAG: tyrosine--tRNA ligase [SAR202 cluster bacterium]|nr:tyrosine--tRNA ligase [Chloroflexota bacterium]MQG39592.1 tyrosine--tRNA ligase [SAR202 cluster bacterium]